MPLIPLSGPISMSMLNTAVARSSTTANSLLANGETPANPGLFYLGYQINNSLNQTAPHAMSEWYGFDTTTTTTTTLLQVWYALAPCAGGAGVWTSVVDVGTFTAGDIVRDTSFNYYTVGAYQSTDPGGTQISAIPTAYVSCPTTTTTTSPLPTSYAFATGSNSSEACSNWENPALRVGYHSTAGNTQLDIGDYLYKNSELTIGADAGYYGGPDTTVGSNIHWFNIASGGEVIGKGSCTTTTTTTSTTTTTTTSAPFVYAATGSTQTEVCNATQNVVLYYTGGGESICYWEDAAHTIAVPVDYIAIGSTVYQLISGCRDNAGSSCAAYTTTTSTTTTTTTNDGRYNCIQTGPSTYECQQVNGGTYADIIECQGNCPPI